MSNPPIQAKLGRWRGIEFHYGTGGVAGGRRGTTHEYPFREDHYDEDLGKQAPRFSVAGYLLQPDVRDKARRLENAFNTPGHGVYYDPWLNRERLCRCDSFTIDSSQADLQSVSFTATFVERGAEPAPSAVRRALASLNESLTRFNNALATGYNLINGTIDDITSAVDGFRSAASYLQFLYRRNFSGNANASIGAVLSGGPGSGLALVESAVDDAITGLNQDQALSFLSGLSNISANGSAVYDAQSLLFSGVGISRYAELAISLDFDTREDANQILLEFVSSVRYFREIAQRFGLTELAAEALCLESLAGERVDAELSDFPFVKFRPGGGKPALVMSYEIYGDVDEADELRRCNGFVSGRSLTGDIGYVFTDNA